MFFESESHTMTDSLESGGKTFRFAAEGLKPARIHFIHLASDRAGQPRSRQVGGRRSAGSSLKNDLLIERPGRKGFLLLHFSRCGGLSAAPLKPWTSCWHNSKIPTSKIPFFHRERGRTQAEPRQNLVRTHPDAGRTSKPSLTKKKN